MNKQEIQQQLLQLENRDVVKRWFAQIHKRELSTLRAREINSAAKQSAEFLRNAEHSSYTVRPLLTYYGISTLTRALVLLLKVSGGENTLVEGHGLKTVGWSSVLSGNDISQSLRNIGGLKVKTCKGLFSDLINGIDNLITLHVGSTSVDWSVYYDVPEIGFVFTLDELLSRIPDLQLDLVELGLETKFSALGLSFTYSSSSGYSCEIIRPTETLLTSYVDLGYNSTLKGYNSQLECSSEIFEKNKPQYLHKYYQKGMGMIPDLYIVQPFDNNNRFSELSIVFLMSYYLGMLVRYYPTHWNSLIQGDNGDAYWPILNRAQNYVASAFPELCVEMIKYILKNS